MSTTLFTAVVPTIQDGVRPRWRSKAPADVLFYTLDATTFLAQADAVLLGADCYASGNLVVGNKTLELPPGGGNAPTLVRVRVAGGDAGTDELVRFLLLLTNNQVVEVLVDLPVRAAPPAGLSPIITSGSPLTVGGVQITVGGQPILI